MELLGVNLANASRTAEPEEVAACLLFLASNDHNEEDRKDWPERLLAIWPTDGITIAVKRFVHSAWETLCCIIFHITSCVNNITHELPMSQLLCHQA